MEVKEAIVGLEETRPAGNPRPQDTVELMKMMAETVSSVLGEWCEVVVHDLSDLQHSIVFVSGNVTARKIGGHLTNTGLAALRSGHRGPVLNYTSYTDDGKTLRSSSIFVYDEEDNPVAAFCVNLNITPFLLFERFLTSVAYQGREQDRVELFSEDLGQMVETLVAECAYEVRKPISVMTKADRMKVVELLEKRGVFQLRRPVPLVARRLGVTQKTIYNYLAELESQEVANRP